MYPQGELIRLAIHKERLRARIAARRQEGLVAVTGVLRPVAWVDQARDLWRRIAPFAALVLPPAARTVHPAESSLVRWAAMLLRWAPLAVDVVRAVRKAASDDRADSADPGSRSPKSGQPPPSHAESRAERGL